MKVLLTGGTGQLGRALLASVPAGVEVIAPGAAALDLTRAGDADAWIAREQPDLVLNAAAYTLVDRAEAEPEAAFAINDAGAESLARAAAAAGARLIHISTDFVFDGTAAGPYGVEAPAAPLGVYGASKRAGEMAVLAATAGRAAVLRTAWLYDAVSRNFFTTMLRLFHERDVVGVVNDQTGTPTSAASLAAAVWILAARPAIAGIHHWTDGGETTWYGFAVEIERLARRAGLLQRPVVVSPIATAEYPTPARRPAYAVLDKGVTSAALGLAPRHWMLALDDVVRERARLDAAPATSPRSAPG